MTTRILTRKEVLTRLWQAMVAMQIVCEPEFVVLFGSFAYGESHEGSDVDGLVVYPDEVSEEKRREASATLPQVFGTSGRVAQLRPTNFRC